MKVMSESIIIAVHIFGEPDVWISGANIVVRDKGIFNPAVDANDFTKVMGWMIRNGFHLGMVGEFVTVSTHINRGAIPYTLVSLPYDDKDSFKVNIVRIFGEALLAHDPERTVGVIANSRVTGETIGGPHNGRVVIEDWGRRTVHVSEQNPNG